MKKLFWEDPYCHTAFTTVNQIDQDWVLLKETIIFSFSGGQESDRAWINAFPVFNSKIDHHLIYYQLPSDHSLKAGDSVEMKIDWQRRYRLMRLHFAAEIILELVTQYYQLEKIGAHIAENKSRIDFMSHRNISEIFPKLLRQYQDIIHDDIEIKTGYLNEAEQRRYWEVKGFSKVPCGGTHVKTTAEVGMIKLKRVNIGGGKERIEIMLEQP